MKKLIITPTYNEIENIELFINSILNQKLANTDIIVIDDNSPDKTSDLVTELTKKYSNVFLLKRKEKLGIGSAYVEGFKYAISKGYDVVIQMDADLSHDPKYLKNAFSYLDKYDFLILSRYVSGGKCLNWSIARKMISRFGCYYAKKILKVNINDFTGGFNIWKIEILKKIGVEKIKSNGYVFQIELKHKAIKEKYSFLELPITFKERRRGKSKISKKIVVEAIWRVWKM